MAVMDEFQKEREALKNAPLSTKIKYFWDYNRGKVIIGIVLLVIGIAIGGGIIIASLLKIIVFKVIDAVEKKVKAK